VTAAVGRPVATVRRDEGHMQQDIQKTTQQQLRSFIERIERLEEEKKALASDIRDVFAEAKSTGFDVKAMRQVLKLRKQDMHERQEQEALVETYLNALGMLHQHQEAAE
jgi:uncharacterized protein (UPF0335 family)